MSDVVADYFNVPYVTVSATASMIVTRAWGTYEVVTQGPTYKVKRLLVQPGKATSYQFHREREEYHFYIASGAVHFYGRGQWHIIENKTDHVMEIIEVQLGRCDEADIIRMDKRDGAVATVDWDRIEADARAARREERG